MNALQNFVRFGIVGDLRLGMRRHEVELKLGSPETWVGKPPTFGPLVRTPDEADVWCYYNEAATVRFDSQGLIIKVNIFPEHVRNDPEPFLHLSIVPDLKMGEFRALLVKNQIDFDEGEDYEPGRYYILAERRCTVMGVPYQEGKLVPESKRKVSMISTVSSDDDLPDFVLRYWRGARARRV